MRRKVIQIRSLTRRGAVLAASAIAIAALYSTPIAVQAQSKNVKIAIIVPLSGPWARQGTLVKFGAETAIDEINAAGGIKALGGAKLELVAIDAGDSAEKAKNAAQRLVAQEPDAVGGMGAWLSTFTLAVTEVTERAHIPWLTLSYSDTIPIAASNTCSRPPRRLVGNQPTRCRQFSSSGRPRPARRQQPPASLPTTPPHRWPFSSQCARAGCKSSASKS
jgi:ABC-type uncharacterized transport system substrate-binding protein